MTEKQNTGMEQHWEELLNSHGKPLAEFLGLTEDRFPGYFVNGCLDRNIQEKIKSSRIIPLVEDSINRLTKLTYFYRQLVLEDSQINDFFPVAYLGEKGWDIAYINPKDLDEDLNVLFAESTFAYADRNTVLGDSKLAAYLAITENTD